jgi:predicted nucleic acid-binding Zn ribbon protein
MPKNDPPMEQLGRVLDKSLKRLDLSPRLEDYRIWPIWNDVVGKPIARNAQPEKIRNGTLFVKVTSPVWMQQLQYMKEMVAERLNQRLGAEVVKNIFFVVGKVKADPVEVDCKAQSSPSDASTDNLQDEEFLDSVRDPEIRQAFKRLLKHYSRRKRKD